MKDRIGEIFDVAPMNIEGEEVNYELPMENAPDSLEQTESEDFVKSRENLKALARIAESALREAVSVARQSESPRAYEVVTGLLKQASEINLQLLDIHDKKAKLKQTKGGKQQQGEGSGNVTNNAIFVGTNAELLKLIKGEK
jgi:hypothetical protein